MDKMEKISMIIIYFVGAVFIIYTYSKTNAFYGIDDVGAVIYTSDSGMIFYNNCYLRLGAGQNDLRQPLFAVFSAPFLGCFYFFSLFAFPLKNAIPIFLGLGNLLLLILSYIMIADMMKLTSYKKVSFIASLMVMYPTMLFSIMLEQYIVSVFWLVLYIYLSFKKKGNSWAFIGAVGTLITNAILVPMLNEGTEDKFNLKLFIKTLGLGVLGILFFCRFDVIYHGIDMLKGTMTFVGQDLAFVDELKQYFEFLASSIVAPHAGIRTHAEVYNGKVASWQLDYIVDYNVLGIIILILVLVGFICNYKDKFCRLAFLWFIWSIVLLLCLGYGTKENGLILYSLYFSWAIWILLYKLIESIFIKIGKQKWIVVICCIETIILGIYNFEKIGEIIQFAGKYYPL